MARGLSASQMTVMAAMRLQHGGRASTKYLLQEWGRATVVIILHWVVAAVRLSVASNIEDQRTPALQH